MQHTDNSINGMLERVSERHAGMVSLVASMEAREPWTVWSERLTKWTRETGSAETLSLSAVQLRLLPFTPARLTLAAAMIREPNPESIQVGQRRDWIVRHAVLDRMCHATNVADTIKTIRGRGSDES